MSTKTEERTFEDVIKELQELHEEREEKDDEIDSLKSEATEKFENTDDYIYGRSKYFHFVLKSPYEAIKVKKSGRIDFDYRKTTMTTTEIYLWDCFLKGKHEIITKDEFLEAVQEFKGNLEEKMSSL